MSNEIYSAHPRADMPEPSEVGAGMEEMADIALIVADWRNGPMLSPDALRRIALICAKVKPLEWRATPGGKWLRATSICRTYEVRNDSRAAEKKAAAQADYAARVLSALEIPLPILADAHKNDEATP